MRRGFLIAVAALAVVGFVVLRSVVWQVRSERVTIGAGDVTLAGKLSLPRRGSPPFPAAVIVHGSGRVGRADLKRYVRELVPRGLAVLTYDKRGVGESGGEYRTILVDDSPRLLGELADDAAAALEYLRGREEIDPERVGYVGASQAGWIMPLAASRSEAAFVVSVSGPAVTYGEEIHYSRLTGDDPGPWTDLSDDEIRREMESFDGPHGFDPLPVLERLEVPQLWILGGRDRSVPTEYSLRNLEELQRRAPGRIDVELYRGADHAIRDARTGRRIDYWEDVARWLERRGVIGPKREASHPLGRDSARFAFLRR
jgi:dienelactone hydrolase